MARNMEKTPRVCEDADDADDGPDEADDCHTHINDTHGCYFYFYACDGAIELMELH